MFELHLYELLKHSLTQIRSNFEILDKGSQKRYRKRKKNILNYAAKNDVLNFRAISLYIALKKWGALPSDHEVNETNDEHL